MAANILRVIGTILSENVSEDNGGNDISIVQDTSTTYVAGNILTGNKASSISDSGTGTIRKSNSDGIVSPSFAAYKSSSQLNLANGVNTKVTFTAENYDHGGNFASSTFTAPIAGIYHFDAQTYLQGLSANWRAQITIYTGGAAARSGALSQVATAVDMSIGVHADLQLAAGTTVDIYVIILGGSTGDVYGAANGLHTYFNGSLIG